VFFLVGKARKKEGRDGNSGFCRAWPIRDIMSRAAQFDRLCSEGRRRSLSFALAPAVRLSTRFWHTHGDETGASYSNDHCN
jgi:hypothetical protein